MNRFHGKKFLSVGKETCELGDTGEVDSNVVCEDRLRRFGNSWCPVNGTCML